MGLLRLLFCYAILIVLSRFALLKPSSNWSLFKVIISDQTLIKLNDVMPIYVYLMGKRLAVFLNKLLLQRFVGLKKQKSYFFRKKLF